jgi:hypothetical protein
MLYYMYVHCFKKLKTEKFKYYNASEKKILYPREEKKRNGPSKC